LTLHFDKLSILSVPKEPVLFYLAFKDGTWRRRTGQSIFYLEGEPLWGLLKKVATEGRPYELINQFS
jgi:hypothetical protein